jgi:Rrf2 family protein
MIGSNRGRYGLVALIYMAGNVDKKVSVKEVAEKEKISKRYLEQIFSALKKNGILISVKGAQGGYLLAKAPKEISVGEVLRSLEEIENVVPPKYDIEDINYTIQKEVWDSIEENISKIIDNTSIEDLRNKHNENSSNIYYI